MAPASASSTYPYSLAAAWGSGAGGTYAVYRDTVPGFTPSAGNLVASGVTTFSYNDATAPSDTVLYYLVRAENDETCGGGPNNGGAVDSNAVYVQVSETTSQAIPSAIRNGAAVVAIPESERPSSWLLRPTTTKAPTATTSRARIQRMRGD